MSDLFVVLADATRREILHALLDELEGDGSGELSVGELVARLSLTQPTVSKHLKTLRERGVVSVREQGQHRYYRLDPLALEPAAEWLGPFVTPAAREDEPASASVQAVADAAGPHPLSPRLRTVAVRIGSGAAAVSGRLPRALDGVGRGLKRSA